MLTFSRRALGVVVCMACLVCASCLSSTLSKGIQMEGGASPSDKRLIDTWELLYQVTDNREKEPPTDGTRTLIEFTDKGRVIFNRIDKDNSDRVKNRTGKYSQEGGEIVITDDSGNTVNWSYTITDDALVITAPELKRTFHWRRFR